MTDLKPCPSCREPMDHPSGDGCANMTAHKERDMSDADQVNQALAELWDIVKCRCHAAYTGRGLHDPDCQCDSTEAVQTVADRIEALESKLEAAVEALICGRYFLAGEATREQFLKAYRTAMEQIKSGVATTPYGLEGESHE